MRKSLLCPMMTAGLALAVIPAWAQGVDGTSVVRVRVEAGVTASVTLSLASSGVTTVARLQPPLRERAFPATAPGDARLVVTAEGQPARDLTLSVPPASEVLVELLARADGSWTPTVVSTRLVGDGTVFDDRWLPHLPSGRDPWTVIETSAPFVIADHTDNGGLRLGRSARVGARGTSWSSTTTRIGAQVVMAPDALGWTPSVVPSADLQGLAIITGLAPIELDAPGAHVIAAPRLPGARAHATFDGSLTTSALVERRDLPWAPALARMTGWQSAHGSTSRPLTSRTGLYAAAAFSRVTQVEREQPAEWTSRLFTLTSHLTHVRPAGTRWSLTGSHQDLSAPYEERRLLLNRQVDERGRFSQVSGAWVRPALGGVFQAALAGHRSSLVPQADGARGGVLDRLLDGRIPSVVWAPTVTTAHASTALALATRRTAGLTHDWRMGGTFSRSRASARVVAQEPFAETVNGLPARIWDPSGTAGPSTRDLHHASMYLGDRVAAGARLTVQLGLRADHWSGSARGAAHTVSWTSVSPRLAFEWRLGPVSLFGGSGRYADRLAPMFLAHGDPAEPVLMVYRWTDANGSGRAEPGERGPLVARRGRGAAVASIDADLRPPRAREHSVGLGLDLGAHFSFRGTATWRRQWDLLGSVNTGVTRADFTEIRVPDAAEDWDNPLDDRPLSVWAQHPGSFGRDAYLLTNPADGTATHEGVEALWTWRSSRLVTTFGAMAYRTRSWGAYRGFGPLENDHSAPGEVFEDPNARPVLQGSHFFDRSYVGKLSGVYRAPGDITFAYAARYQDGQPFARVVIVPDLPQGPELVHAYRVARTRYTYALTLDLRLEKGFRLGAGRAAVRADVFNATRHRNEMEEDASTRSTFRLSTAMQPPLTARLGFRFDW